MKFGSNKVLMDFSTYSSFMVTMRLMLAFVAEATKVEFQFLASSWLA